MNYIYRIDMFNEELKRKFISQYQPETHKFYERVFYNSAPLERELNKDLHNFTIEEVESVLYKMRPLTLSTSRVNASIMRVYFDWAIRQKLTTINSLDGYGDADWLQKFVVKDVKLFVTEEELQEIEDYCVNAQDALLYRLLFEGVYGAACAELVNLMVDNVDIENRILTLRDGDKQRKLQVSHRCIDLIQDAIAEEIYMKSNGEAELIDRQREYVVLVPSKYILRPARTQYVNVNVNNMIITRRLKTINTLFGYPHLTPKNLHRSGMIHMAKQLGGELTEDDLKAIADRFGVKPTYALRKFLEGQT